MNLYYVYIYRRTESNKLKINILNRIYLFINKLIRQRKSSLFILNLLINKHNTITFI